MMLIRTELRPSIIHGMGLFSLESVTKGKKVWEFTPLFDWNIDNQYIEEWASPVVREYLEYYGTYHKKGHFWTSYGDNTRFINHSNHPNLMTVYPDEDIENRAIRDIIIGEELTIDYFTICDKVKTITEI